MQSFNLVLMGSCPRLGTAQQLEMIPTAGFLEKKEIC